MQRKADRRRLSGTITSSQVIHEVGPSIMRPLPDLIFRPPGHRYGAVNVPLAGALRQVLH